MKCRKRVLQSLGIAAADGQDLLVEGVRGVGVRGPIQRGDQPRDRMLAFVRAVEFDYPLPGVHTHRGCGLPAAGERDHDAASIFARLYRKTITPQHAQPNLQFAPANVGQLMGGGGRGRHGSGFRYHDA